MFARKFLILSEFYKGKIWNFSKFIFSMRVFSMLIWIAEKCLRDRWFAKSLNCVDEAKSVKTVVPMQLDNKVKLTEYGKKLLQTLNFFL